MEMPAGAKFSVSVHLAGSVCRDFPNAALAQHQVIAIL